MEPSLLFIYVSILVIPGLLLPALRRFLQGSLSTQTTTSNTSVSAKAGKFPGPRQFPIVGRVHDLPTNSLWLKFKEWADIYGPIYETSMLGQKFIIVSDEDMATELLIKMGNNFAGRPQLRALIDHKLGPTYVALQDRNETWKTQRKWVHAAMAAAHKQHFYGHIEKEVKRYLVTLLVDPSKFHSNMREMTGRIMGTLSWDDATLGKKNGELAMETLTQMSVSGPIVNTVTPIWHVADFIGHNPWRKYEVAREGNLRAWWIQSLRLAKKRYLRGDLPSDTWSYRYCQQLIKEGNPTLEQDDKDETFAACMLGFQCLVGVITISAPMQFFLMAMALHPEWQKKAQEEIDRVCRDRMPGIQDYESLPTLRACVKETMRWRSGVPLGVPHQCETASEYRGVHIEKGTIILACEWNINRVESKYPDPDTYRPDRWLDPSWPTYMAPLSRYPNLREGHGMHTFGWGRRACLGQTLADDEMFIAAASICWGFDMGLKKCPSTGEDIVFDSQATNSNVILEPTPFPMEFKPRGEERARLIMEQYAAVRYQLKPPNVTVASSNLYETYKNGTRRLVYWLIQSSNHIVKTTGNTADVPLYESGALPVSALLPMSRLVAAHVKPISAAIFHLFESVIALRSAAHEFYLQSASDAADPDVKARNASHKFYIDALRAAFEALGGDEWKKMTAAEARAKTNEDDIDRVISGSKFAALDVGSDNDASAEESDSDSRASAAGQADYANNLRNQAPKGKGKKSKGGRKGAARHQKQTQKQKQKQQRRRRQQQQVVPLTGYRLVGDGADVDAEYCMSVLGIFQHCHCLRSYLSGLWAQVAYNNLNGAVPGALSLINVATVKQMQSEHFVEFPDRDSYDAAMTTIVRGDSKKFAATLPSPWPFSYDSFTGTKKGRIESADAGEFVMTHTNEVIISFITSFRATRNGKPTKRLRAIIDKWDPDFSVQQASPDQRIAWRRSYTINWLYDLINAANNGGARHAPPPQHALPTGDGVLPAEHYNESFASQLFSGAPSYPMPTACMPNPNLAFLRTIQRLPIKQNSIVLREAKWEVGRMPDEQIPLGTGMFVNRIAQGEQVVHRKTGDMKLKSTALVKRCQDLGISDEVLVQIAQGRVRDAFSQGLEVDPILGGHTTGSTSKSAAEKARSTPSATLFDNLANLVGDLKEDINGHEPLHSINFASVALAVLHAFKEIEKRLDVAKNAYSVNLYGVHNPSRGIPLSERKLEALLNGDHQCLTIMADVCRDKNVPMADHMLWVDFKADGQG